jgi:hypothetical protein
LRKELHYVLIIYISPQTKGMGGSHSTSLNQPISVLAVASNRYATARQ